MFAQSKTHLNYKALKFADAFGADGVARPSSRRRKIKNITFLEFHLPKVSSIILYLYFADWHIKLGHLYRRWWQFPPMPVCLCMLHVSLHSTWMRRVHIRRSCVFLLSTIWIPVQLELARPRLSFSFISVAGVPIRVFEITWSDHVSCLLGNERIYFA